MLINRLAIIGVGLIGGSLARALRYKKLCGSIIGFGRNRDNLKKAVELNVIDEFSEDIGRVVKDADVVVIATPLATYEKLFLEMRASLNSSVVITDVGSVKGNVVDAARRTLGDLFSQFIPGHPIAGNEKSGVEASFAELFDAHRVILTPLPESNVHAIHLITQMWEATGADVVTLDVEHHDAILAATSHLPHLLAYSLVDCLASMQDRKEIFKFAAGGFADFSRIASSNPQMWHDICFANRKQLLATVDKFTDHLNDIKQAIEEEDSAALLSIFTRAKQERDKFTDKRTKRNDSPE